MSPRDWRPSRASRTWRARARPPRPRSEHTRPWPHPPPGGRLGYGLSSVAKLGSLVLHMMPFWIFEVSPGGSSVRRSHEDGRVSWQGLGAGGGPLAFLWGPRSPGGRGSCRHQREARCPGLGAAGAPGAGAATSRGLGCGPGAAPSAWVSRCDVGGAAGDSCPRTHGNGTMAPPVLRDSRLRDAQQLCPEAGKPWIFRDQALNGRLGARPTPGAGRPWGLSCCPLGTGRPSPWAQPLPNPRATAASPSL